jgi:hypothetical protein
VNDPAKHTVTTTFSVSEVTFFQVVKRVSSESPRRFGFGCGVLICQCMTKDEAERIARLLADGMGGA